MLQNESQIELNKLVVVDPKTLKLSEYNPRQIDPEHLQLLKTSMSTDPDMLRLRPPVVNAAPGRENIVFMGNQRVKAAIELGWSAIPVIFVNASIDQEKAWNIKDNYHSGHNDQDLLKEVLWDLRDSGWNMEGLGATPTELDVWMEYNPEEIESAENKGSVPRAKTDVKCPNCGEVFTANDNQVE